MMQEAAKLPIREKCANLNSENTKGRETNQPRKKMRWRKCGRLKGWGGLEK